MKRFLIIAFLFTGIVFPSNNKSLYHSPPQAVYVDKNVNLSVTLLSDHTVIDANGYYRKTGNITFQEIPLQKNGHSWSMTIPGKRLSVDGLEYYFLLKTSEGGLLAFPAENPMDIPYFVNVLPKEIPIEDSLLQGEDSGNNISADILILSPEPGSIVIPDDLIIAVSLFNVPNVDSAGIRLYLDGEDVTEKTEISGGVITYIPVKINNGNHTIGLYLSTINGVPIEPLEWSFTLTGAFSLSSDLSYNGDITTRVSSEYVGSGLLNVGELIAKADVKLEFAKFTANIRRTTRENPFQQPLNRFSTQIQFGNYLNIRLGDFYKSVTPYTLDGRRIRGLNLDVDLKFARFEFVKGQINRAVQHVNKVDGAIIINNNDSYLDTTGNVMFALDRTGYMFDRDIILGRLSFDLFSKYQIGVHFLKSADDINSIEKNIQNALFTIDSSDITVNDIMYELPVGQYSINSFTDAVVGLGGEVFIPDKNWGGRTPEDNLVLGFDLGTLRDKKRLKFDFSWNLSLYNRDIWDGVMSRTELDTALDDTLDGFIATSYDEFGLVTEGSQLIDTSKILNPLLYENIFIMNINMLPLIPIDISTYEKHPIITVINMPSSAFHLRLLGNYRNNKFTVEYRQIGPQYVSLANPYLTANIREFVFSERLILVDNKIMISAAFKYRDNKILNTVKFPLKTNTIVAGITFIPGHNTPSFVVNFQSIGKNNSKTELEQVGAEWEDKREDSQTNNSFFSMSYPFSFFEIKHNLSVNLNSISNQDLLKSDRKKDYFFQKSDSKTISVALSSRFTFPLRTVANVSRTTIRVPVQDSEGYISTNNLTWLTMGLNGNYALWKNKLKIMAGLSYLTNQGTTPISLYGLKAGGELNILSRLHATLSGNLQLRSDNSLSLNTSGLMFTIRYNFK